MLKKALLGLVLISTAAFAGGPMTVDALVKDAAKLDKKEVLVRGKVFDYLEKTSKKGNPYTVFKIGGAHVQANVYLRGRPTVTVKSGLTVDVSGTFSKLKQLPGFSVANEIDASAAAGKPYGLKLVKSGK